MKYENLVLLNELVAVKLSPLRIWKAGVSTLAERIGELWAVVGFC